MLIFGGSPFSSKQTCKYYSYNDDERDEKTNKEKLNLSCDVEETALRCRSGDGERSGMRFVYKCMESRRLPENQAFPRRPVKAPVASSTHLVRQLEFVDEVGFNEHAHTGLESAVIVHHHVVKIERVETQLLSARDLTRLPQKQPHYMDVSTRFNRTALLAPLIMRHVLTSSVGEAVFRYHSLPKDHVSFIKKRSVFSALHDVQIPFFGRSI